MPAGAQINQVQDAITESELFFGMLWGACGCGCKLCSFYAVLQQAGLLVVQSYALAETATEEVARLKEDNSSLSKDLARLLASID